MDAEHVAGMGRALRVHPAAPVLTVGGFVIGLLLFFPLTPLLVATTLIFPPAQAFAYCYAGALGGAAATYALGRFLGQQRMGALAGPRTARLRALLVRRGFVTMVIVRLVPLGNFSISNMLAGALRIPVRDFALGNMVGLLPGILALTLLADRLASVLAHPQPRTLLLLGGCLVGIGAVLFWLRRRAARAVGAPDEHGPPP
jgi:uncharacterized membrane protein YdjX (TVP38/TMEM64 family)